MATLTRVLRIDDIDGTEGDEQNPVSEVQFSLDGQPWAIDLRDANAKALREALAQFIDAARVVGKQVKTARAKGRTLVSVTTPPVTSATVRNWAKDAGLDVPMRGRLSAEWFDRYHAATK